MIVAHKEDCEAIVPSAPGFEGASMRALIGPDQGWQGHVMRLVALEKDGHTSRHSHPWPHINYFSQGEGILFLDGKEHPVHGRIIRLRPGKHGTSVHKYRARTA